jgi:hypothetical protein
VSLGRRYLKPGWMPSRLVNPLLMRLGIIPTLAVRGRTSGEWRTVPVNVLELAGQRYLVAPARGHPVGPQPSSHGRRRTSPAWPDRALPGCRDHRRREAAHYRGVSRALGLPGSAVLQGSAECGRSSGVQDRAPTPGSPTSATTWPWPASARASACPTCSSSDSRPTRGVMAPRGARPGCSSPSSR